MNKLNITDLKEEQKITPILRLGFRPLFLFGNVFALLAMAMWLLMLRGDISAAPLNGSFWWHSHEMLFDRDQTAPVGVHIGRRSLSKFTKAIVWWPKGACDVHYYLAGALCHSTYIFYSIYIFPIYKKK